MSVSDSKPHAPDRAHLLTEQRLDASHDLDTLSIEDTLRLINEEDAKIAAVVRGAIPGIARLAKVIATSLHQEGRLIYVGAGTSGRLGVLDASECPPTFNSDPHQVIGIIAGGDQALRHSSETAEDDPTGFSGELKQWCVGAHDIVVGIAAGRTTRYVLGALYLAKQRNATTALICCAGPSADEPAATAPNLSQECDHVIHLPVGPEVLAGSTRMKAGTATKLVLNMLTTAAFVQLGKVWGNLMVDLRVTNTKLRDRAIRIMIEQCPELAGSRQAAQQLLAEADGSVKLALVMAKRNVDAQTAAQWIEHHNERLRPILGPPK